MHDAKHADSPLVFGWQAGLNPFNAISIYLCLSLCINQHNEHIYMHMASSGCIQGCYVNNMLLRNSDCYQVTFYVILSMGCWIGASVETPYLVQPLVKTVDRQPSTLLPSHQHSTLLKAQNGLRKLQEVSLVLQELTCVQRPQTLNEPTNCPLNHTDRSAYSSIALCVLHLFPG